MLGWLNPSSGEGGLCLPSVGRGGVDVVGAALSVSPGTLPSCGMANPALGALRWDVFPGAI